MTIDGLENYISNPGGWGINWLRQTYIYFIVSSVLYAMISYLDGTEQHIPSEFYLRIKNPSKLVNYLSVTLVLVMLALYFIFY